MEQKLLLIDSDPYLPARLKRALEGTQMGLDWADNAIKACAMTQQENYDLIVMEMELPYMHGLDALPIIKRLYPSLPVIVYTPFTFYQNHEETRLASGYVIKRGQTLGPVVRAILGISGASAGLRRRSGEHESPMGLSGISS